MHVLSTCSQNRSMLNLASDIILLTDIVMRTNEKFGYGKNQSNAFMAHLGFCAKFEEKPSYYVSTVRPRVDNLRMHMRVPRPDFQYLSRYH